MTRQSNLAALGDAVTAAQIAHDKRFRELQEQTSPDGDVETIVLEHATAMEDPAYAQAYADLEAAKAANYEALVADSERRKPALRARCSADAAARAVEYAEESDDAAALASLIAKRDRLLALADQREAALLADD